MTFEEFLQTQEALAFRNENLQNMIQSLREIANVGNFPIANNTVVLTALANQNINEILRDYFNKTFNN